MNKKIFFIAAIIVMLVIGILFLLLSRTKKQPAVVPPPSQENINTTFANINTAPEVLLEDNLNEALEAIDMIQELEEQQGTLKFLLMTFSREKSDDISELKLFGNDNPHLLCWEDGDPKDWVLSFLHDLDLFYPRS